MCFFCLFYPIPQDHNNVLYEIINYFFYEADGAGKRLLDAMRREYGFNKERPDWQKEARKNAEQRVKAEGAFYDPNTTTWAQRVGEGGRGRRGDRRGNQGDRRGDQGGGRGRDGEGRKDRDGKKDDGKEKTGTDKTVAYLKKRLSKLQPDQLKELGF